MSDYRMEADCKFVASISSMFDLSIRSPCSSKVFTKIPSTTLAVTGFIQFLQLMTMFPSTGAEYFKMMTPGSERD